MLGQGQGSGGTGGGCAKALNVQVPGATQPGRPIPVTSSVQCPTPQSLPGSFFGPGSVRFLFPGLPVGSHCVPEIFEPTKWSVGAGGQVTMTWTDPNTNRAVSLNLFPLLLAPGMTAGSMRYSSALT